MMFRVAKIAVAEFIKTNKDWYLSEEQSLMRNVMGLDKPEDFVKVQLENPEEAPVQGIEYYFKLFTLAFKMNFHLSIAGPQQLHISWPIYQDENYPTRDFIYFQMDETTIYLLQEVRITPTPSVEMLSELLS